MVQERFVERWWHLVVRERSGRRTSISRPPSSPVPDGQHHHHHPQEESGVVGEYSSSHHKNRRRATLIMDASKLISEDGEGSAGHHGAVSLGAGSKPAGKHRRRHTDSGAATYDGFVEYLIALSKQQHQSKQQQQHQQHSAHQHQQSHEPQLHLGSLPPLSEHPDASMIEGVKHVKANINTSMLSSSLSAISAYPTPPRTSEISTGFLGAAPAAEIPQVQVHVPNTPPTSVTLGPHTLSSSNLTAGIGAAVASAGADGSVGLPLLSSSLNDSISKLSTSIPMGPHPYSRTSIGSTGSYQRKRHPKPMLHAHSHQPSSIMVPKSSSFTISSILLKLIDQQLDGKFSGFTAPCVVSREHADRAAYSVGVPVGRVVHASGGGLPATRETSASLCYGCRGVVAVGPEKVQVVVPAVGVCDSPALALQQPGVAVWPALVPFPKQGDELLAGATTGLSGVMLSGMNVSPASPRSPLSPSGGAAVDGFGTGPWKYYHPSPFLLVCGRFCLVRFEWSCRST
ncbi:hypothetical protein BC830DRAFT_435942 [Chytriomyces sp. MP71]|nr:hypothetical protein BC830DRAFT_435942 [Chytriomyces sp. MP71]